MLEVGDLLDVLFNKFQEYTVFRYRICSYKAMKILNQPWRTTLEIGLSPFQQKNRSPCAIIDKSIMTQAHTHMQRAPWVWRARKGACQEVSETHTNAPHFHVCTLSAKHAHKPKASSKIFHSQPPWQWHAETARTLLPLYYHPTFFSVGQHIHSATLYLHLHTFYREIHTRHAMHVHILTCLHWLNSTALTHSTVSEDTHPHVTFYGHSSLQTHAYIQHSPTQGTMLCVKRRDPDGSHLLCADGLLRWLRTGYVHTHTQMATHWEWSRDGRAGYWFAQINDSQPGHLTLGELRPLSWHTGLAHWAHIIASMRGASQLSFNPDCHFPKYIF